MHVYVEKLIEFIRETILQYACIMSFELKYSDGKVWSYILQNKIKINNIT